MEDFKLDTSNERRFLQGLKQFFLCFLESPWSLKLFIVITFLEACGHVADAGDTKMERLLTRGLIALSVWLAYRILVHGSNGCRIAICILTALGLIAEVIIISEIPDAVDLVFGSVFWVMIQILEIVEVVLLSVPATSRYMQVRRDIMSSHCNESGITD